jgi:ABC-2 type transport system permease protein
VTEGARAGDRRAAVYARAVIGLVARDLRVLRRDFAPFLLRTVMNPIMFVFVFAYLFPKIGEGYHGGAGNTSFGTILGPGLVAVGMIFQGIAAVALPLVNEFGRTREIEDRLMAPIPIGMVAVEKIVFGSIQSLLAALVVFPVVYIIPATPVDVHVEHWTLLIAVLLLASLISGAFGLVIGTIFRPQRVPLIFSTIVIPITFLGCVYYPWALLAPLRWLQVLVLVNPVVYISEALRAALTPGVPHMPPAAFLSAILVVLAGLTLAGMHFFLRRVTS